MLFIISYFLRVDVIFDISMHKIVDELYLQHDISQVFLNGKVHSVGNLLDLVISDDKADWKPL